MNLSKIVWLPLVILLAAFIVNANEPDKAEQKPSKARTEQVSAEAAAPVATRPPAKPARVLYRPPKMGKPARTVGGGSRGTPNKVPKLYVVAPAHVGQTTSTEPSLYWYVDRVPDESIRIEFTVLDEESIEPRVETTLETPRVAGVQRIRLSDYGLELVADTEYQWSVALVLDPDERSKDIVASGWIDHVAASTQLATRLEQGGQAQIASVYAEEGIWYDAFSALSEEIDRHPEDGELLDQRADLLRQVGLEEAAGGASE
ncbi:MAG: DUF928 domain-containing protein [Deltaproteobacteria bacterium]|nr:DUF928 domain-containing protein [Deltaproteobacteria bacterium]MBW2419647.1 DUF928 domain-containing protein [Deltaproteobacteria bacterium]